MNDASTLPNPKIASAAGLYLEGIRDGQPQLALEKYTGHRYTQHSTGVGNGKEGFMAFFEPFLLRNPDRDIKVIRKIVDGPYVFCHVFQSLNQGESEWVTMDLFDTDDKHRIIEHWDVIAAYEKTSVSGNDMVAGEVVVSDLSSTDANKSVVNEYTKQVLTEQRYDRLANFVTPELIQHAPHIAEGAAGIRASLENQEIGQYEMLFKIIGQGNFVVTYSKVHRGQNDYAVFDVYRLAELMIVEHWSLEEKVLPRDQWGNSGKF